MVMVKENEIRYICNKQKIIVAKVYITKIDEIICVYENIYN